MKKFMSVDEPKTNEENEDIPVEETDLYVAFIDEEERERGRISKWNYLAYFKACGVWIGVFYLLFSVINQGI